MTDPKELRIGNLVCIAHESDGPIVIIVQIRAHGVMATAGTGEYYHEAVFLLPIPITPDWLARMGFEINGDVDFGFDSWRCKGFAFHVSIGDSGTGIDVFYHDDNDPIYVAGLDYVHQLQNLYFALTGEEIKIKDLV